MYITHYNVSTPHLASGYFGNLNSFRGPICTAAISPVSKRRPDFCTKRRVFLEARNVSVGAMHGSIQSKPCDQLVQGLRKCEVSGLHPVCAGSAGQTKRCDCGQGNLQPNLGRVLPAIRRWSHFRNLKYQYKTVTVEKPHNQPPRQCHLCQQTQVFGPGLHIMKLQNAAIHASSHMRLAHSPRHVSTYRSAFHTAVKDL